MTAPAPAPTTPPMTAPAARFCLLITAPAPAPTTPPMTAPLAVLLQPFFAGAAVPVDPDEAVPELVLPELLVVALCVDSLVDDTAALWLFSVDWLLVASNSCSAFQA